MGFALRRWCVHGVILHRGHRGYTAAAVAPMPHIRSRRFQSPTGC
jgi:hypothetical protein